MKSIEDAHDDNGPREQQGQAQPETTNLTASQPQSQPRALRKPVSEVSMLQTDYRHAGTEESPGLATDLRQFYTAQGGFQWRHLFRHLPSIALLLAICLGLAIIYVAWRPTLYSAKAEILVDHRTLQALPRDSIYGDSIETASGVVKPLLQNQVAVIQSEPIALAVIDNLKLDADQLPTGDVKEALRGLAHAVKTSILNIIGFGETASRKQDVRISTLNVFKKLLSVETTELDYTIEFSFTAPDPELAANVTNEIVRVYVEDQKKTNEIAAQRASGWLRSRLVELGTTARVLANARAPGSPDGLGTTSFIAAAVGLGLVLGFAAAFLRELVDRRIRSAQQVATATGARYLGGLPRMKFPLAMVKLSGSQQSGKRLITRQSSNFSWALDYPLSRFAHTIKGLGAIATKERKCRSIGITSLAPREGRTTIAANMALTLAKGGSKILLVDAVPYNRALSRGFGLVEEPGLIQVLNGRSALSDAVWIHPDAGSEVLPLAGMMDSTAHFIWSKHVEQLIQDETYDYVIFDLPPLLSVSDVVAAANFLDRFVLVLRWECVTDDQVSSALASAGAVREKLLGVVLNHVQVSRLQAFIDGEQPPTQAPYVNDAFRVVRRAAFSTG